MDLLAEIQKDPTDIDWAGLIQGLLERGFSELDLAKPLGLDAPAIRRWRDGRSSPHPALAKHFIERWWPLIDFTGFIRAAVEAEDAEFVADAFKVSTGTISRWASGKVTPSSFVQRDAYQHLRAWRASHGVVVHATDVSSGCEPGTGTIVGSS